MGNDLALTMAPWTGGTDSKKPLGLDHLSPAAAGGAEFGLGAGFKAIPLAMGTGLHPGNFQFHFFTLGRFHERNGEIITKIRSFPGPRRSTPAPSAKPEKVFKDIPETGKNIFKSAKPAEAGILQPLMAEPVIKIPFLGIMKDLIGLGRFLKPFFGFFISGIAVRMILESHFPVGFLDFLFIGLPGNSQHLVVIPFMIVVRHIAVHTFHPENLSHAL